MKNCNKCSKQILQDSNFCTFCGVRITLTKAEKEEQKRIRAIIREEKRNQKIITMRAQLNDNRQKSLEIYRQNSDIIKGIKVVIPANACGLCESYRSEIYKLDDVPALPDGDCLMDWCRACYSSVI